MTIQDEIEAFFSKAEKILFVEKELSVDDISGIPLIFLLYSKSNFDNYMKSGIYLQVLTYFSDKRLIFQIILEQKNLDLKISIVDKGTGDAINAENVIFHNSIYDFLAVTNTDEPIALQAACHHEDNLLLMRMPNTPSHVMLDGYSVVYI